MYNLPNMAGEKNPILPSVVDLEPRPEWTALSRNNFPDGSLGFRLFPVALEGRLRPGTVLSQPPARLFDRNNRKAGEFFSAEGLSTCMDLLSQPFTKFQDRPGIGTHVADFLKGLTVTPQGRLLAAASRQPAFVAPLDREMKFVDSVNTALNTLILSEDDQPDSLKLWLLLVRRFGLFDGVPHTLAEVGKTPEFDGISSKRVWQLEVIALSKLRSFGKDGQL